MPYLFLALAVFLWSLNSVLAKTVTPYMPPMAMGFWRWLIALAVLLPLAWRPMRADWPVLRRHWRVILLFGIGGGALHNAVTFWGLTYTTAVNTALLNSAVPMMTAALSWLLFGERLTRGQWSGVGVSTLGVLCILLQGDPANLLLLRLNAGDLLILVSMTMWAAYTACLRLRPPGLHPLSLVGAMGTVGLLLIVPPYGVEHALGHRVEWRWEVVAVLAYMGALSTTLGYLLWNHGVGRVGTSTASAFTHLGPVYGSGLAWMLLGEQLHLFHLVGVVVILAGVAILSRARRAVAAAAPESAP